MQPKAARHAPQYQLEDHQVESEQAMRYGSSKFEVVHARDLALAAGRTLAEASQSLSNCTESVPSAIVPIASRSKGFVLPEDNRLQSPSSVVRRKVWRINSANHGLA